MEQAYPDNDLLIKYLLNEVNTEEGAFVMQWVESDIQNRHYFQQLEKVWILTNAKDAGNNIDADKEWIIFQQTVQRIHEAGANEQWITNDDVKTSANKRVYKLIISVAVAASLLLIVSLGWIFFTNNKAVKPKAIAVVNEPKDSVAALLRHELNNTGKPKRVQLPDGTVIVLEDKSEVRFFEPFPGTERHVSLLGKANFKVAKDKTRPFTVFSDDISTTVLGTVFDVSAYKKSNTITIRLYEGKVVVKSVLTATKKLKKDVYLTPGYELLYSKENALASVNKFSKTSTVTTAPKDIDNTNPDNPNFPKSGNSSWYMFNNQPLSQVFDQLREMYKADITYNKKDVQKLYFIGQFNRADSLETILNQIAKTNDLTVTKSNNTFIISK